MHGAGLDEISPLGPSKIIEIRNTASEGQPKQYETKEYVIDPKEYGFPGCTMEDLKGGGRDENARLLREALSGGTWDKNGKKDALTLNAGMGLYVYGMAPTIEASFELARKTLESGAGLTQVCAGPTVYVANASLFDSNQREPTCTAPEDYTCAHMFASLANLVVLSKPTNTLPNKAFLRPPSGFDVDNVSLLPIRGSL